MDPALSALGLKVAAPAVLAGYRALRHELARRPGDQGLIGLDDVLDEAIAVLAREADGLWKAVQVAAKGALTRPALFDEAVPRAWIATEDAQLSLKLAARAAIRGEDDGPHAARAVAHYQLFLDEDDETAADAATAYAAALEFLLASLRRALTPGDRAILQAVHGLREEIERIRPEDTSDIIDAYVEAAIRRLRAQRFFRSADSRGDAAALVSALIDGRLQGAGPKTRASALAWCARILSFGESEVARAALARASVLGDAAMPELRIAQAFIAAIDDYQAGLALLDVDQGPAVATAAFQILRRGLGTEGALARAPEAGLDFANLDSDGRYSHITALVETGDWAGAVDATRMLAADDFETTPALLWVAGTALVAAQLPDDLKRSILQDIPAHPAAFPLRDDQVAREQRQLARNFMDRAAQVCAGLDLAREAAAAERYSLWLGLRDPGTREEARAELRRRIDRPGSELLYLPLALGFETGVDRVRAEAAIRRRVARGATDDPELAGAAVALLLDYAHSDPGEAAAFIDRQRTLLVDYLDPASFVRLEIGVLTSAGRHDAARALLAGPGTVLSEAFRTLLASAVEESDAEPSLEVLEAAYGADPQTATLAHLVERYRELDYSPRFLELARRLLAELPTHQSALECLVFLGEQGRYAEALELVELLGDLITQNPLLALQAGWIYFWLGRFGDAEAMLRVAEAPPGTGQARILRYQLLVASGRWEAIDAFLEEQWQARAQRSPLELAQCATLAAQTRAKRVTDLVREAAARAPDDPQVLVAAYSAATAAGLEEAIPEAGSWIMRAAELSDPDGPIQKRSLAELLDDQPEWEARVADARRGRADAEMPLAGVAMLLRQPWLELQLAPLLENPEQPFPKRRRAAPLFSGRQRIDAAETFEAREIALDRHAIVTLAAAGTLDAVVAAFDRLHVPHDLFSDLFEQCHRVAFHQPSKIAFAHRLLELLARGRVKPFEPGTVADVGLITEIGESRAALLSEAVAQADGQHVVVHPHPITRVGSLLSEPVPLDRYAAHLCSCLGVLDALERAGRLSRSELDRARAYLEQHDRRWPDEPVIEAGATLYLSDLAVDYFRYTGLIDKIAAAGLTVVVAKSELAEAEALRGVDALAQAVTRVIDGLRATLAPALAEGRLCLGAAARHEEGEGAASYIAGFESLIFRADTLVSDDRFFNRYAHFEHPSGKRRILSSLDLVELLSRGGRIEPANLETMRAWLRGAGAILVGTRGDELLGLLRPTVPDAAFRETGDLRAIRENLRLAQMRGWFDPKVEIGWLVAFQEALGEALVGQWRNDIPDPLARARSDWLFVCMQSRDWADTDVGAPLEGLACNGMVLDLAKLVGSYRQVETDARPRFAAWLEQDVLAPLWDSEPRLEAIFHQHLRELLLSVAADLHRDEPQVSERRALLLSLHALPDFLQVALLQDENFRARTGHALEATVEIGKASFLRSAFWRVAQVVYAEPEAERRIADIAGNRWTLRTEQGDGSWPLLLRRKKMGYRTRGLAGLHPDASERVAMLDALLADYGQTPASLGDWHRRLLEGPLDAAGIEALDLALRGLPGAGAAAIVDSLSANEASISLLVPPSRAYWSALLGDGPAEDLETYVTDVLPGQLARLRAEHQNPDRWLLLLAAHPRILGEDRFGSRTAEEWHALGRWAVEAGDPMAKAGFIELALPHVGRDAALDALIVTLADQIEALDPEDASGALHLVSSLAMFVDGELSRLGVLADWPPFRRRLASLAQAALIARIVDGQIDTQHFAAFCTAQRGWRFLVQNLLDLQREPRWRPDFITAGQLKHELIGRIVNAAGAMPETDMSEKLRSRFLGQEDSLRARMAYPMVFWPGPLEGGSRLQPLPEALCEDLDRAFAEETPNLEALMLLANLAAMFAIPDDLVERAVARIRAAGPRLLALIPTERVYAQLLGLAHVAASHRAEPLADAVQVLARVSRLQVRWPVAEEMQLALYAAASREAPSDWRRYLGNWIAELVVRNEDRDYGTQLLTWTEALCEIDPIFRTKAGSAVASLRLLLDR
ncbi:hypothetical protein [Sphingomonas sp. LM7]|uniref:HTH domain-containing protein n=1 Tax=Sphingomonas sp. LM7 TaxID=1938607 RepID=UPI000983E14E|nr:hypothetical protein [Sphingomonas sp. LM7]AQR72909.1 hypothetical protein BXU08_03760 [Sphingomonas sp. LM7]